MNSITAIPQLSESQSYQQSESFYKNLVESELHKILHYYNLVNGKEEKAQGVWFTVIFGTKNLDYKSHLEEAGFKVKVIPYLNNFTEQQKKKL